MTNEPAFPILRNKDENGYELDPISYGITIRDYFAAKAMQGIILPGSYGYPDAIELYCKIAYKFADEMLKARLQ
jgi:hypothetical protein